MPQRAVFLTASWNRLLLFTFPVRAADLEPFVPPRVQLDTYAGQAYVSVVGFSFENTRLARLPAYGHRRFCEVNLRFYVRRTAGGMTRRGVIFVQEIVARPLVAFLARWCYGENYVVRGMRDESHAARTATGGFRYGYAWRTGRGSETRWNRLGATAAGAFGKPPAESLEEFIVEHYWGYACRRGQTLEYEVAHPPWRVAPADDIVWDCDPQATYGRPWSGWLNQPPVSVILAEGSSVTVRRAAPLS